MRNVIVVESPAKARKISTFFKDDTVVTSSLGHIRDLPKDSISIDIENNFEPNYQPIDGKKKTIKELKFLAKNSRVLLAADDDREGDAIAWHCGQIMGVDFSEKNRIIFHEISKNALLNSMKNVHELNMNSVNAQQARRVIDRLVGYSLSPLLWKNIKTNVKGLSAGRVQSTLLLILKEHEESIKNYKPKYSNEYLGEFKDKPPCELILKKKESPVVILELLKKDRRYEIKKQYHKEDKKYPGVPFITSSLQQTAQSDLGFSVKNTMNIAQKLYENGKITYMRTDSTSISPEFKELIKDHITENFGERYYQEKEKTTRKVKGAQEAHECIRVTKVDEELNDKYTEYDKKLYELIKKRTICSQMKPAIYDTLIYELSNEELSDRGYFKGNMRALLFDGYLRYSNADIELQDKIQELKQETYRLTTCVCSKTASNPPQFLNESSIVKKLEKSGIGRPSTYASIIGTLYNRNYTEVMNVKGQKKEIHKLTLTSDNEINEGITYDRHSDQKKRIVMTDLGNCVLRYLLENFSMIVNIEFTSLVEDDLDRINRGELEWKTVVKKVYDSFSSVLNVQRKLIDHYNETKPSKQIKKIELGKYEGEMVILKDGKYGPYVTIKDKNISLAGYLKKVPTEFNEIKLKNIKGILPYPIELGEYKGEIVKIQMGPYGKYIRYRNNNFRIQQKDKYTLEDCIPYINRD